jgi:hypothetical protein
MTDYSELIYRLNNTAPNVLKEREAADALAAQAKRIEELRKEADMMHSEYKTANARIAELEAEKAELRVALKPFSDVAEHDIDDDDPNEDRFRPIHCNRAPLLTVGDLRRARAAILASIPENKDDRS